MPSHPSTYIIAARRTAIGRVGGLHRRRRIEELGAPVVRAVLEDAGLAPGEVDELVAGNTTAGGNPARLIALAAGLPDTTSALTIDRDCASGLDAILYGTRLIATGEASVVVAGGAESLSTAPWRITKPRTVYQTPQFESPQAAYDHSGSLGAHVAAAEKLAGELQLTRETLDAYALRSHVRAFVAQEAKRLLPEIVTLKMAAEETRDESLDGDLEADDLAEIAPFVDGGRLTPGNTSLPHDGAAFALLVSEARWKELGQPAALRLLAGTSCGVAADAEASAPVEAIRRLGARVNGAGLRAFGLFEVGETFAGQAIAVRDQLGIEDVHLNPDGGAVARGLPIGASGAVAVTRLFSRMVRQKGADTARKGIAAQGARGGIGVAAAFEAV